MFAPTAYLRWARRFYGRVEFDLATSGMTPAPIAMLGPVPSLEDPGAPERLREAIATYNRVAPIEVIPTFGTTHALWAAYSSLLSPGDEVLIERPAYEPLYRIAEGLGARVTWFDRRAEESFALDPERVEAAMTPRTKVIALSNLHNPSGARATTAELRDVAQLARERDAYLLVDEVYAPFDTLCDGAGTWSGSARHLGRNVVVASSLTKGYGLGAFRIGWLIGPPEVIERSEDAVLSNLGHAPLAWSALALAAFEHIPELAARARENLHGKRERVDAWVASRPHLRWSAPRDGLFGFALDTRGGDLTADIERAAIESGVLVAPGSFFGVPNGFRLAWSIEAARLADGLNRLERALV